MAAAAHRQRRYRPRVEPRKGPRGLASRIDWDRAGRIALVLVLFFVAFSYINPIADVVGTWRDSRAAEERLVELREENAGLKARAQELKEPAAALQEARKLGFVGEGERSYKIEGLE